MRTLLVLEDEPLIAITVVDELEAAGFSVTSVMSCEEAIASLECNTPDAVVVDVVVRDGSSEAVASKLVEAKIPFIVYSGDQPQMHESSPFSAGLWVSKSSAGSDIVEAVDSLLTPRLSTGSHRADTTASQ